MNLRPLVLDDAFKAECQRLRDFAADPKNWYVLGDDMFPDTPIPTRSQSSRLRITWGSQAPP